MLKRNDETARGDVHFGRVAMMPAARERLRISIQTIAERNGKRPEDFVLIAARVGRDGFLMLSYDVTSTEGEFLSGYEAFVPAGEWLIASA